MNSAADLLILALTARDIRQSDAALQQLRFFAQNDWPALVPDLHAALTHADSLIRCRAIRALAFLTPEPASCAPLLLDRLRDSSWPVREAAALALANPDFAWPGLREALLISVLHDPQQLVRLRAAGALGQHPEESGAATTGLCQALQHPHVSIRCRAVMALGQFPAHASESLPHIRKALQVSHWRVRMNAAHALGQLGEAAHPALADLMRRTSDGHSRVSRAASAALNQISLTLPESLRVWLEMLVWRQGTMDEKLRHALERPDLPEAVQRDYLATVERRKSWYQSHSALDFAVQTQEQAWLAAKLLELLCRHAGI